MSNLTPEELTRYARHITMPEIGLEGQETLKKAKVLCVGIGGLGSASTQYLVAAGIGTLGLVDNDTVEASNLQRQVIHHTLDIKRAKTQSAAEKLSAINPYVTIKQYQTRLTAANAKALITDYDIVVDGSDNFTTRFLLNDACVMLKKPLVHASIFRFEGQVSVFDSTIGPCYRCLFPEPPSSNALPNCAEAGVLGVLPGLCGLLQAIETIKWITQQGEPLIGRLLTIDTLTMTFTTLNVAKNPHCPLCSSKPTITTLRDHQVQCQQPIMENSNMKILSPNELKQRLSDDNIVLLDVREPHETAVSTIGNPTCIPLGSLAEQLPHLDKSTTVIAYCKSGGRSARACAILEENGFEDVYNLTGGITAWVEEIEPNLPYFS